MKTPNQGITVISGPTASGKSGLAESIAEKLDAVIVNADSQQVYKELPILSAQPKLTSRHLLYGVISIREPWSVSTWLKLARECVERHERAGRAVIVVGGTGFYIDAFLYGLGDVPEVDASVRQNVQKRLRGLNRQDRHSLLLSMDPVAAEQIKSGDSYRIMRAIEVFEQTGKSITSFKRKHNENSIYKDLTHICLLPDRKLLYENCNSRFEEMIKAGVIDEVKNAREIGESNAIGFKEIVRFLDGFDSFDVMKEKVTQATRNYAKRQCTWFRNKTIDLNFIRFNSMHELEKLACKELKSTCP